MKIRLEQIDSKDRRTTAEFARGEIIEHDVLLSINGRSRAFKVYLKANVLPAFDASLVYGDELVEELLRFQPAALSTLCSLVGQFRRRKDLNLPVILLDDDEAERTARASG